MNKEQVEQILEKCLLPDSCEDSKLVETNISWILLTKNYAFKIKKPVKLSFLDFSTLEKRKYYCHRELELNKRLEPGMYKDVLSVETVNNANKEKDYCVQMQRFDNNKEMDNLLKAGEVKAHQVVKLSKKIVDFHEKTKIIKTPLNLNGMYQNYADILSREESIKQNLDNGWLMNIEKCVDKAKKFLHQHEDYMIERIAEGYIRDCHGDLNTRNIFLTDRPIIFDCIEFNDKFRQIDILNDVAFLCMDLEFFDNVELAKIFYQSYQEKMGLDDHKKAQELFYYYKSYRANVRAKVSLLALDEIKNQQPQIANVKKYIELMYYYTKHF
jgi:hypothetical protein